MCINKQLYNAHILFSIVNHSLPVCLFFKNYLLDSRQDTKNDFKIPAKRKEMFRPTPQKMATLCYVTPVTGHKAYTGKEEEEDRLD
jgi:hypothetical protein